MGGRPAITSRAQSDVKHKLEQRRSCIPSDPEYTDRDSLRCATDRYHDEPVTTANLVSVSSWKRHSAPGRQWKPRARSPFVKRLDAADTCQSGSGRAGQIGSSSIESAGNLALSGKGVTLRPLPPLRTVHDSFPSHGSSLSKARFGPSGVNHLRDTHLQPRYLHYHGQPVDGIPFRAR